jgi:hypothetical protein
MSEITIKSNRFRLKAVTKKYIRESRFSKENTKMKQFQLENKKGIRIIKALASHWFARWARRGRAASQWEYEQLLIYSHKGWVDPVPDPLLRRKSGSAGNRTRTSGLAANRIVILKCIKGRQCEGAEWPIGHRMWTNGGFCTQTVTNIQVLWKSGNFLAKTNSVEFSSQSNDTYWAATAVRWS